MVSIVIPAFNEEPAVAKVITNAKAALDKGNISTYEIIVVDDCSADKTFQVAGSLGVKVLRNLNNIGYGFSLKQGIKAAQYDTIVILDCDETYPSERIPDLIKQYNEGYQLVIGQRTGADYNPSFKKFFLRKILSYLIAYTVGKKSPDVNSGLRVFSKASVLPLFPYFSNTFSFTTSQTLVYTLQCRFISYVPVTYSKRTGLSKVKTRDIFRTLQQIVELILIFNPLKIYLLFIVPLSMLALLSAGLYFAGYASLFLSVSIALFITAGFFTAVSLLAVRNKFPPVFKAEETH